MLDANSCPSPKKSVMLREEFDDWGMLFDQSSGEGFGLNPVSVFIWKQLDGKTSLSEIVARIKESHNNVHPSVDAHVEEFVRVLVFNELAEVPA